MTVLYTKHNAAIYVKYVSLEHRRSHKQHSYI